MLVIWKLRDRPRRLISNGFLPSMRWPLSSTSPLLGPKRPLIRLNSVDLPAPFGPMIADPFALRDRQVDAANDLGLAKTLAQVFQFQSVLASSIASLRLISFSMSS